MPVPAGFFNVAILACSNALAFAATTMMMLVGSLLGAALAPDQRVATLPIAAMVVGTVLGVLPASRLMQQLGRRLTLRVFIAIAVLACLIAAYSVQGESFVGFCLAAAMLGFSNAAIQQIRFAAMECVPAELAVTAASIIMLSGVVAAVLGPELAVIGQHLTAVEYQGAFWLVAALLVLAGLLLGFYTPAVPPVAVVVKPARPVRVLLANPAFCLAVASAALGFMVMTFVMTATPISMHHHYGHSLTDTKWVIQSHIAAMFLPSLLSPWLFRLLGIRGMMVAGLACYGLTITIGLLDRSVMGFWSQLVVLGVGWNFLFVAGTGLLPQTYLEGEQFKAQGFNDGVVFSIQALSSLSAGWAISHAGWAVIVSLCLLPVLMMAALLWWNYRLARAVALTG